MAIDFWKNGGIRATAFNDCSLLTCIGNDYDYKHVFEKPIEMFAEQGDVLIAISSSGKSENILLGVKAARTNGCRVITFSGFDEANPLRRMGDYNFYVPSMAYGHVEVVHQSLCHCLLDYIMVGQGKLRREDFLKP
jgi:D-sedoheptulose 7-phosphate isomerase